MEFVLLLWGLSRLVYPLVALGVFVVLIWSRRHDTEHVRRMADAYAVVAWPRERRQRLKPGSARGRRRGPP